MKYKLILFILLTFKLNAQINLKFDKRFVECEDKWVVFKINEDSTYTFGFIYIDEQAGLTLNREGNFKIKIDNSLKVEKLKEASIKIRLQANNTKVALLPSNTFKELQIEARPKWLKFYKTDTTSVKRLYKWGYMYNGWNECSKALSYLTKAKKIDPKFEGLNVELAFSYNCLKEFGKAEQILDEELKLKPTDAYVNKEYIYAISKTENIEKAIKQYLKSLETVKEKNYNAENCFNILQFFYNKKDKKNFNIWYEELNKCSNDNKMITEYANNMKTDINK
jgi:tetratricopeptide (TPR) repeat protein